MGKRDERGCKRGGGKGDIESVYIEIRVNFVIEIGKELLFY